jgi:hypothetical protein
MAGETTSGLAEPWRDPAAAVAADGRVGGRFRVLDADHSDLVTCVTPGAGAIVQAAPVRDVAHRLPAPDSSVAVSLAQLDRQRSEVVLAEAASARTLTSHGQILTAALLVGILESVRDMSVAYVSVREQFGKPVGSFQAVKHRCADMAVRAEAAGSLLWLAALTLDTGAPESARLAASVKALASEYAVASAHDNVQNHGGMGFTAECSAHLYVKRALVWSVTLGSPEILLAEVAR